MTNEVHTTLKPKKEGYDPFLTFFNIYMVKIIFECKKNSSLIVKTIQTQLCKIMMISTLWFGNMDSQDILYINMT